ncbi:uncharacterized protein CDAR_73631 [Caerostris darwini]|uniref:Uncharacterized protein n=1 Tax=Caerostris darwini TaxID=1538125 RepID=A0AAV4MRX7_9ARAC|nr:uncharacterized protein CDAR_73631 [Caerostris darwini]
MKDENEKLREKEKKVCSTCVGGGRKYRLVWLPRGGWSSPPDVKEDPPIYHIVQDPEGCISNGSRVLWEFKDRTWHDRRICNCTLQQPFWTTCSSQFNKFLFFCIQFTYSHLVILIRLTFAMEGRLPLR